MHVDNVTKSVNKVASAIHKTLSLVKKLTSITSHNDKVTHVVNLEVSHDICQLKIRYLFLWLKDFLLGLLFSFQYGGALICTGNVINDFLNEAFCEVKVDLCLLFHEDLHVALVGLLTLNFKQLAEVRLRPSAHSLDFTLGEGVQDWLGLSVDIVDEEVVVCLLDVLYSLFKHQCVWKILLALGTERERVATNPWLSSLILIAILVLLLSCLFEPGRHGSCVIDILTSVCDP